MRVCVTGGTGLVGRRLCAALLDRGDQVTVITRDPFKAAELLDREVDLVAADPRVEGRWQVRTSLWRYLASTALSSQ